MNRQNVDVESIEINFPSNKFNLGFTFQDTPGVDSNVATHQSSTEQFMYTSNLLFYTVDYNHVQSALNFKFMKRINEVGIPIIFGLIRLINIMKKKLHLKLLNQESKNQSKTGISNFKILITFQSLIIHRMKLTNFQIF